MTLNISNQMIDIIDNLRKVWMSCVIHICKIYQSGLKNSHTSVVNSIYDLYPFKLFNKVKNVVPVNEKAIFLVVFDDF